jgi:hypothetical protein
MLEMEPGGESACAILGCRVRSFRKDSPVLEISLSQNRTVGQFSPLPCSRSIRVMAREAFEEQVLAQLSKRLAADEGSLCPGLALKDLL